MYAGALGVGMIGRVIEKCGMGARRWGKRGEEERF